MTAGLSRAILAICKPTPTVKIQEGKHNRINYFMQNINNQSSEKERIGAIDQVFTCLAARTAQNLALEGLEDFPMSARLINNDRK
jgi:hypothetical protein